MTRIRVESLAIFSAASALFKKLARLLDSADSLRFPSVFMSFSAEFCCKSHAKHQLSAAK